MAVSNRKAELERLVEQLYDPVKLRVFLTGIMLLIGYLGIYLPLSGSIEETTRELNRQHKRHALADDISLLRAQIETFQDRLPENTDTNEWVQYVLDGVRKFPPKLIMLDSEKSERVGSCETVALHVELQGQFHDLDRFLHWLECNQRLFRVNSAKIMPASNKSGSLVMQLALLGLKG